MSKPIVEDDQPLSSEPPDPSQGGCPVNIYIDAQNAPFPIDEASFDEFIRLLLTASGESDAEISISFVSDSIIQDLNRRHRGQDRPTDVLSFSLREGEPVGQLFPLGDLVISVETAKRQAEFFGNRFDEEIKELLFHGFLHLLGHDHEGAARPEWDQAEKRLIGEMKRRGSAYRPKGLNPESINHIKKEGRKT
ncbi:MAG: rRNA maturation RNase YbeY [Candidatus Omnitrophica bacterium]|nr:rRNA maturation RNase YbeY [Candidatus Omnitrophota bacterium]